MSDGGIRFFGRGFRKGIVLFGRQRRRAEVEGAEPEKYQRRTGNGCLTPFQCLAWLRSSAVHMTPICAELFPSLFLFSHSLLRVWTHPERNLKPSKFQEDSRSEASPHFPALAPGLKRPPFPLHAPQLCFLFLIRGNLPSNTSRDSAAVR